MIPTDNGLPDVRARHGPPIAEMRLWNKEKFEHGEPEWQELLTRSGADPLFMSWAWQWTWWRNYAARLKSRLYLVAAYAADGTLVGLAPLHLRRAAHRRPLSAMRLEIIGSTWRHEDGAYSEYLDLIADERYAEAFLKALATVVLRESEWSDLVVANSKRGGLAARFVSQHLESICYVRENDPLIAQLTELPRDFSRYVQALNSGVRRKLWNQRSKLTDAKVSPVTRDNVDDAFSVLNEFHDRRWGRPHYRGRFRNFHTDFARLCADRGILKMSVLSMEGRPISVMYNVRIGSTEYNIQSGFDSTLAGLSPGYLHFGFCIESACNEGASCFDFLAGNGRNRDYKRDFNTKETELVTFQCIRMRPLAWLYRGFDRRLLGTLVPLAALPASGLDCDASILDGLAEVAKLMS